MSDILVEKKVNEALKNIPLSIFDGDTYEDFINSFQFEIKSSNKNNSRYVIYNSNNFCTDGNNLYVYFSFQDSLNHYIILRVKLDDIKNKLLIDTNEEGIFSELKERDLIYKSR